jgi:hypothetical protein
MDQVHNTGSRARLTASLNWSRQSVDQGLRLDGRRGILVSNPDRQSSGGRLGGLLPYSPR